MISLQQHTHYIQAQEFTIASCLTAYHRAAQVELDLEITAGSCNVNVNLPVCFN